MNIQRYTFPVVVAAALHGALFIGSILTTKGTPAIPPPKPKPPLVADPILIEPFLPELEKTDLPIEEVKPIAQKGEVLPELEDRSVTDLKSDFAKPEIDAEPIKFDHTSITKISKRGTPDGMGEWDRAISATKVFGLESLDRAPNARVQPAPDYPMTLKHQGVTGSVVVEFDVDIRGQVVRASAVRYTHSEFVEPALRAVRNWRFEPGKRNGVAVPFRMMIPIEFGLEN